MESGDLEGRTIAGKYAVLSVIGQGAMGVVYRARQIALDKVVALKVLGRELRDDQEFVRRFHTEARAASRLDHPNSTHVLDFGEEPDGLLYIAMELLQGRTLSDLVQAEFPLAPARVASIMSQTLSAVGAAHALKILHRDLKPDNIVILEGRDDEDRRIDVVKVCDFGIAKLESEQTEHRPSMHPGVTAKPVAAHATSVGVIIGTPQYMSPEQARGESLDVRSDLYSLGVVLYEVLTKRAPFDQGTPADVLRDHVYTAPTRPSALQPDIDPTLESVCLRALQKQREHRFTTAREMRQTLRPLLENASLDVPVAGPSKPTLPRTFDASAPTISAEPVVVAPRSSRRAVWLLPLTAALGGLAFWLTPPARFHPTQSGAKTMPVVAAAASPIIPADSTQHLVAATVPPPADRPLPKPTHPRIADNSTPPPIDVPRETPPPPPPPPTATATATVRATVTVTPTATATVTPTPVAATTNPRVVLGPIHADRVNVASVESALRHIDFTACFRASPQDPEGDATLTLDMDDNGITHADLVGGSFGAPLRQCVARRAFGVRVPNVDTGEASARVTLRFLLR